MEGVGLRINFRKMKNKKIIFGKRGEMGETITWIGALPLIFILLVIFLVIAGALAAGSAIPIIGKGKSSIEISEANYISNSQNMLFVVLDSPFENGKSVKDGIIEWKVSGNEETKEKLEEKIKEISEENLKSREGAIPEDVKVGECYFFEASSNDNEDEKKIFVGNIGGTRAYFPGSAKADIFYDNKKIEILFYYGECREYVGFY